MYQHFRFLQNRDLCLLSPDSFELSSAPTSLPVPPFSIPNMLPPLFVRWALSRPVVLSSGSIARNAGRASSLCAVLESSTHQGFYSPASHLLIFFATCLQLSNKLLRLSHSCWFTQCQVRRTGAMNVHRNDEVFSETVSRSPVEGSGRGPDEEGASRTSFFSLLTLCQFIAFAGGEKTHFHLKV